MLFLSKCDVAQVMYNAYIAKLKCLNFNYEFIHQGSMMFFSI